MMPLLWRPSSYEILPRATRVLSPPSDVCAANSLPLIEQSEPDDMISFGHSWSTQSRPSDDSLM